MARRSPHALTKVSADLPTELVVRLDRWKASISGLNRSRLISDLLAWALDKGAIDALYPDCAADHAHPVEEAAACDCPCPPCREAAPLKVPAAPGPRGVG